MAVASTEDIVSSTKVISPLIYSSSMFASLISGERTQKIMTFNDAQQILVSRWNVFLSCWLERNTRYVKL
jgi:hypothetical protein